MSEIDWSMAQPQRNFFADFASGVQFGQQQRDRKDRRAAYDRAATDPRGAQLDLMKAGDLRGADWLAQDQADERAAKAAAAKQHQAQLVGILQGLGTVPEGQRLPALQKAIPMLQRLGVDPAELADTTEEELSNAGLAAITGQAQEAYKQFFHDTDGTITGVRANGDTKTLKTGRPPPPEKPISVSAGATLYDPTTRKPIYTAPRQFAPRGGGGGGGAALPPPPAGWSR